MYTLMIVAEAFQMVQWLRYAASSFMTLRLQPSGIHRLRKEGRKLF